MASEPNGMNVDDAAVVAAGESSTAGASPERVLPLGALEFHVPHCSDKNIIDKCARETIEWCVTEAAGRLAVAAADESARGNRRVITADDMERAILGLKDADTVPGTVLPELIARANEKERVDKMVRRQKRARKEEAPAAAVEQKAVEEGTPEEEQGRAVSRSDSM